MCSLPSTPTIKPHENAGTDSTTHHLLLILSQKDEIKFFNGKALDTLLPASVSFSVVNEQDYSRLREILREQRPDIILGGWSTPPLPDLDNRPPAPYYCHICGAVRKQVPRAYMEQGMKVTNWGTAISKTVAEAALLLGLACFRNLGKHQVDFHLNKKWRGVTANPKSFLGIQAGIHGFGNIGQELALLLKALGANVVTYDPYVNSAKVASMGVENEPSLTGLFQRCDIVFECCGLTPETVHIVDAKLLAVMKDDATFVNVGRGNLVDEAALIAEVSSGRLRAGLDVFSEEPVPEDSPLRGLPGLVAMPHLGGIAQESFIRAVQTAMENIHRYVNEQELQYEVSLAEYDRMT
ncbi:MAG: NAD(P)-dependent oxidoreductase [Verrucomicrobiota bacterium JB024]|nr:NAD(P)-dependent oxidoreductase [Verrucomicrobiota bacterium JB024]